MNIVFWTISLAVTFSIWLLLSVIFIPLGNYILSQIKRLYNILITDTNNLNNTKENKEK